MTDNNSNNNGIVPVSNIRYRTITTTTLSQEQAEEQQSSLHDDNNEETTTTTTIREGHLLSLMMFTGSPGPQTPPGVPRDINPVFLEFTLAAYLAWRDINERRSDILPHLPQLLDGCDFYWTYQARDTANSPRHAINELLEASSPLWELYQEEKDDAEEQEQVAAATAAEIDVQGGNHTIQSKQQTLVIINHDKDNNLQPPRPPTQQQQQQPQQQAPFAIAGNLFSSITQSVTALASALEIPQISGTATSMLLEKGDGLFARTIPTNAQDAAAVMTYYSRHLNVTRVASVFINEPYGIEFNKALKHEASTHNITLLSFPMNRNALADSMADLKESQARYIFAIVLEEDWQPVVQAAYKAGIMGIPAPQYSWLVPELAYLSAFTPDRETQSDLAHAMHGLGLINLQMKTEYQHKFNKAIQSLVESPTAMDEFIQSHTAHPELFDNWTHPGEAFPFLYHHLVYDSVIALGLAACATPGQFTGSQLFDTLKQLNFSGVSGQVTFHPNTGTRDAVSTQYRVDNLLLSNSTLSQDDVYHFDTAECIWIRGDEIYQQWPFVFADNTTTPPLDIPPLEANYDYHYIPQHLLILGYCLGGGMILFSLLAACWTIDGWKSFVVSAAQPVFLLQLCLGVIIMAIAIFPLGMQGEESLTSPQLNMACMSIPWLLFCGFVIALTALMSKTWRVSQIMGGTNRGKKTLAVSTRDVIAPLLILLPFNIANLIGWTIVSPYQYVRIPIDNYDEFGRSIESFGTCQCPNNWAWLFAGLMCCANGMGSLFVMIQCYQTRHISLYFSETNYLAMSLASLTECVMVGGPLLFLVRDQPSAFFMMSTVMICIVCLSFLLPIFGFKFVKTYATYEDAKRDTEQLERNTEIRNQPNKISSLVRESNLRSSNSVAQTIDLPPGFMEVRRLDKSADDDSVGGCSYKSGRSAKSHSTLKSTSTRTSLLTQASTRVIRAVKHRTSTMGSTMGMSARKSFGVHPGVGGIGARPLPDDFRRHSTLSDPGLSAVVESRTTYNSTNEGSRPLSASMSNVPTSSRTLSSSNVPSRRFSTSGRFTTSAAADVHKSTTTKSTLPFSVSFSAMNLDSEVSEALTVDDDNVVAEEEEQDHSRRRKSTMPFRKSMPKFAARLERLSTKDAPPPGSVSFPAWNSQSDVSEALTLDEDFAEDYSDEQQDHSSRRKSLPFAHISMYDAQPTTTATAVDDSFSSLKDISNHSSDGSGNSMDQIPPPDLRKSSRASLGNRRRSSILNSIVEKDEDLTDSERES